MARANPAISSIVSPFILIAVMKEAIWLSVAEPLIISCMTARALSEDRGLPSTTWEIASRIIASTSP
jgi:hypothetical protein